MPIFRFHATDTSGSEAQGQIDAADETEARKQLHASGYRVQTLEQVAAEDDSAEPALSPGAQMQLDDAEHETQAAKTLFIVPICCLFFIAGCVGLYYVLVRPMRQIGLAKDWQETPCAVVICKVVVINERRTDGRIGSTNCDIDIVYQYKYDGVRYEADRTAFLDEVRAGLSMSEAEKLQQQHPPGKELVCYVNPDNPSEAVLNRGWTAPMRWIIVLPVGLIVVSVTTLLFLFGVLRFPKKSRR